MPPLPDAIDWYDAHVAAAAARYEGHDAASLNSWLTDLLPKPPAGVMDVSAGSGRDAAWLASSIMMSWLEPSQSLCAEASRLHSADRFAGSTNACQTWPASSVPGCRPTRSC